MIFSLFDDSTLRILLNEKLYDLEVINKAFYWYLNEYQVSISILSVGEIQILLKKRKGLISDAEIEVLTERIKRDLLDFQVRQYVNRETKTIREILIAKAFSGSDEFDEVPPGSLRDTVGENSFTK